MKSIWNRFSNLVLHGINGMPFDYYLFLFLFFSRIFELFIAGDLFSVFGTYEHEFMLFEKYTYFLTGGYLVLYFLVYLINHHRLPINKTMSLSLLFFLTAVASTLINQGMDVRYDYYTKLALMELMMTAIFMFYTASRLDEPQFRKLMRVAGKGLIYLILFFNIISLIAYFAKPAADSIMVFGRPIEIPKIYFDDRLNRQYDSFAGFFRNSQTAGEHIPVTILIALYLFSRKELNPVTTILTAVTGISMVALAHSRTGMITSAIITVIYIGALIKNSSHPNKNPVRWYCLFLAVIAVIGAVLFVKKSIALYHTLGDRLFFTIDRIVSGRASIYVEIWNFFKAHPIIGAGWNTMILQYDNAHNFLLTALAWTGLIGFILMICLLVSVVVKGIKTGRIRNNALLFMIPAVVFIQCMLEQGVLGDARHAYTYMFWLVLGYFASDRKDDINSSAVSG